jgi:hypothetical protein
MKPIALFLMLLSVMPAHRLKAQQDGGRTSAAGLILPAALIAYGAFTQISPALKRMDGEVNRLAPHARIKIDDYLQYAPAVAVFGLDPIGIKARHSLRDRIFLVTASSYLIMAFTVHSSKLAIHVERPDASGNNSFPSGHTATAFTGAHILYREYRDTSPWICVAGYAAATATGMLRIVNRKHWLSDVAAGAGVGILSVEAAYLLMPSFRRIVGEGWGNIAIVPLAGHRMYGAGIACRF